MIHRLHSIAFRKRVGLERETLRLKSINTGLVDETIQESKKSVTETKQLKLNRKNAPLIAKDRNELYVLLLSPESSIIWGLEVGCI